MLVNGYPKNQETFARVSGYVEQVSRHLMSHWFDV